MKKIVSLVVLAALFCFSIGAFAEGVDLASMTDEELVALKGDLDKELIDRGVGFTDEDRISSGKYVVGTDIKAGMYDFFITETSYFNFGDHGPQNSILIRSSDDTRIWSEEFSEVGTHLTLKLEEGTYLEIVNCGGFLKAVNPSWVP